MFEQTRIIFDLADCSWDYDLLETRGTKLALVRQRIAGTDDAVGRFEVECLTVVEVDDSGLLLLNTALNPDALDDAARRARRSSIDTLILRALRVTNLSPGLAPTTAR